MTDEIELGRLDAHVGKPEDRTSYTLAVDRFAADPDGTCHLIGVIGPQAAVKALRAAMNAQVPGQFELTNVPVTLDVQTRFAARFQVREGARYALHVAHLGYGHVHALFVSRAPGFLRVVTEDSVYHELKRPHHTTPVLRSWVDPIRARLAERTLLRPLWCWRCECGVLVATPEELDEIVEAGVRDGSLPFREQAQAG